MKDWKPTLPRESAFDLEHPAWKLWYALLGSPAPTGTDEAAEVLEAYQRWYAHELAEKQRDYAETEWSGDRPAKFVRRLLAGRLADLIDPEHDGS